MRTKPPASEQLARFHTKGTAKPPFEGTLVGRLRIHGSGDSVHAFASTANGTLSVVVPHGEIEQAFAEFAGIDVARGLGLLLKKNQQQTTLRCGIADFEARDGIAKVEQVVFDTQVVILTGLGQVNLRNERLHLQLTGAAFVDPGLNKSADCQALLADAKAMGAPLHTAAARPHKRPPKR